jgi:hypothetical protein
MSIIRTADGLGQSWRLGLPSWKYCLAMVMLLIFSSTLIGKDYSFKVRHQHVKGNCAGDLIVNESGIQYQTANAKDGRHWTFDDIQEIQFINQRQLNVLTYEDSRRRIGGDRTFKFEFQDSTIPADLAAFITAHFSKPVSNRLTPTNQAGRFEILVKHLHRLGGCPGKLVFRDDGITFVSDKPGESRQWRYSDVQSIASSGPYELRLGTYEHGPAQYGDTKEFRFQLKEKLDAAAYQFAWLRINDLSLGWKAASGPGVR